MPVNVGTLVIDLVAGTASFSAAMDKMSALSAKTANDISRSLMKISVAGMAAVGAIVGGFVAMTKSTLEGVGALDRMAQTTGTTVETLSLLEYAASTTGVETETLTNSLVKLSKAELAASTGNVQLQNVFKKLGVETTDGNKHLRDSGVVYEELAVKFAGMQDGATKTALALQLFGKSGASQIPLLNRLGTEIVSIRDEAQRLGLIVGTDTANAVRQSEEELKKLETTFKAIKLAIVTEALPAINDLLTKLFDIAKNADIPALMRTFGDTAAKVIIAFGEAVAFAAKHVTALKVALEAIAALQIARILAPIASGLASGGIANLGAGVGRFATSLFGLQKVIPVVKDLGIWIGKTTVALWDLASTEGVAATASYALETALAAIGGIPTLIVAGLAAVGTMLYALRDKTLAIGDAIYKVRDIWVAAWKTMAEAMSTSITVAMANLPTIFRHALEQAKQERVRGEAKTFGPSTSLMNAPAKTAPDITGLGKPEKDPYQEAIDKLNLAIDTQQKYIAVLGTTPEAIQNVTDAEKAEAIILELNNKLKEKNKSLTADQKATITQKVATEAAAKAIADFGKSLDTQTLQEQLAAASADNLAAVQLNGVDAVRAATVENQRNALTLGKTKAVVDAMGPALDKLGVATLHAMNRKGVDDLSTAINDQEKRLAMTTKQAAIMADAYGKGDAAIAAAKIQIELLGMTLGKSDEELKLLTAHTNDLTAAMRAVANEEQRRQAAQDLKTLQDEAEAQQLIAAAVFGTIDAQRQAEAAAKTKAINDAIEIATDDKVRAALKAVRDQMIANMQAANALKDAQAALSLESPAEVFARETDQLNHAIEALKKAQGGQLTYGQQLVINTKQQELFNKQIEATVKDLLNLNTAKAGVQAFFLDMQKQAITAAQIIYQALHKAFDDLTSELAKLATTGKADFAAMFKDIGGQMIKQTAQKALQTGLSALAKAFPILGPLAKALGPKPDGSTEALALWVRLAGGSGPGGQPPGGPGGGATPGGMPSVPDLLGTIGSAAGGLGGLLGGLFTKLGGLVSGLFSGGNITMGFIPHAAGGPVSPGSAYLVRERGPELFESGEAGNILTNEATKNILSTAGETPAMHYYNIDARGTDPVLTEQRTRQAIIAANSRAVTSSIRGTQELYRRTPPNSRPYGP